MEWEGGRRPQNGPTNIYQSKHSFAAQFWQRKAGATQHKRNFADTFSYFIAIIKIGHAPLRKWRVECECVCACLQKLNLLTNVMSELHKIRWRPFGRRRIFLCCLSEMTFHSPVALRPIECEWAFVLQSKVWQSCRWLFRQFCIPRLEHAANGSRMPIKIYRQRFFSRRHSAALLCETIIIISRTISLARDKTAQGRIKFLSFDFIFGLSFCCFVSKLFCVFRLFLARLDTKLMAAIVRHCCICNCFGFLVLFSVVTRHAFSTTNYTYAGYLCVYAASGNEPRRTRRNHGNEPTMEKSRNIHLLLHFLLLCNASTRFQ